MTHPAPFNPFLIGCIGAIAPEIIRLYKLRFNANVRWSWSYLTFSVPFILLGGFMAHILEPTSNYAAFYTGLSTPFIITTLTRDSEQAVKASQYPISSHVPHQNESNRTTSHSGLRGANNTETTTYSIPLNHPANQHLSRRNRTRLTYVSKRSGLQAFLKAL